MLIDCRSCTVRGDACADCVVTFLTIPVRRGDDEAPRAAVGAPGGPGLAGPAVRGAAGNRSRHETVSGAAVDLDDAERHALSVLADGGLVPPLRLVRAV